MSIHIPKYKQAGGWHQLWCDTCREKLDSQQPGNAAAWRQLRATWTKLFREHSRLSLSRRIVRDAIDDLIGGYEDRATEKIRKAVASAGADSQTGGDGVLR